MGACMLRDQSHRQGIKVGRRHITALMLRIGVAALVPQLRTSKRALGHAICPHWLRKLAITRRNQIWAFDTEYIPMTRSFVDLTATNATRGDCRKPSSPSLPVWPALWW